MNEQLDKWLQKNVAHRSDQASGSFKRDNKKSSRNFNNKKRHNGKRPFNRNQKSNKVRFIPLGGLNEVGKNMMAIECGNDIVILDMGLLFPEEDMLGVDYIIPDTTYLEENKHKIRGVLITHGHLDHIGAIPAISPKLGNPTFYGTKLTMGLIGKHLEEWSLKGQTKLININPGQKYTLGVFKVEFFRVNHSIPDSCGIIIDTPAGKIVHTGDFKFDPTPADGVLADYKRLEQLGRENVLALFTDSTNSSKPGTTMSEKVVGEALDQIISNTKGRLIIASFSSLIGRMQQIIDSAKKNNRKIFISGRSMVDNVRIATKLGYLKFPKGLVSDLNRSKKEARNPNALILTTGSQGESLSGLTRMAINAHKHVKIGPEDTVVFSSSPIIGNERAITAVVNELARRGAKVINNKAMDVHTTGHGHQEDLKRMYHYIKPKYIIPVHGEFYMRKAHKELLMGEGAKASNIILADNGSIIEAQKGELKLSKESLDLGHIMIDNSSNSLSDVASHIISERQSMALNGVIIPSISIDYRSKKLRRVNVTAHGFIYMKETESILKEIEKEAKESFNRYRKKQKGKLNIEDCERYMRGQLQRLVSNKLERMPLLTPQIIEI